MKVGGTAAQATVVCHAAAQPDLYGSLSLRVTETKRSAGGNPPSASVVIGSAPYKLAGGGQRRLSVTLNRTGKSLLRSRHTLAARLRLTIGNGTVTRTVTFTRVAR